MSHLLIRQLTFSQTFLRWNGLLTFQDLSGLEKSFDIHLELKVDKRKINEENEEKKNERKTSVCCDYHSNYYC